MPDTLEAPATTAADEFYNPPMDDAEPAAVEAPAAVEPEAPATPPPAAAPPPEAPAAPSAPAAPVSKHSQEMIQKAAILQISDEDVEAMSPAELQRTIAYVHRHGQYVYDAVTQQARQQPAQPVAPAKPAAPQEYDLDANPQGFLPEVVASMREAREAKREAAEVKQVLQQLQAQQMSMAGQTVHQRITGMIHGLGADVAKSFDLQTPKGMNNFNELMDRMATEARHDQAKGKFRDEADRLRTSVMVLGLMPAAPAVSPADAAKAAGLEARKEEFRQGALGQAVPRGADSDNEYVRVRELLKEYRKSAPSQESQEVDWLP